MKLKKCKNCSLYTLKEECGKCSGKTSDAHYKFISPGMKRIFTE